MSTPKERIDMLLVEQGHYPSREQAKKAIMAGLVLVDCERIEKVGMKVPRNACITVKGALHPYVSRGGLKLEKAIHTFQLTLTDRVMLDIGASTGGFTDCALQHGVRQVYAIDVGYNQLAWSLRNDKRVIVMERTNFRYIKSEDLTGASPNVAVIDVSFISVTHMLAALQQVLAKPGQVIALIKPQFEAGKDKVGKSGVIRDPRVHEQVLHEVLHFAAIRGFKLKGLTYSPITGAAGNVEFLAYWLIGEAQVEPVEYDKQIANVVQAANETFYASS